MLVVPVPGDDFTTMSPKPGKSAYLRNGYLAPTERVLFETHPSKWFYFPLPVFWLVVFGFASYAAATSMYSSLPAVWWLSAFIKSVLPASYPHLPDPRTLLLIVCLVATLVVVVWLLKVMYEWVWDTYVLTDDRIIEQKGIIGLTQEEIPLNQIRDVEVQQLSWTSRLLRIGTIEFKSLSQLDFRPESPAAAAGRPRDPQSPESTPRGRHSRYLFDPREPESMESGVESWVGVPTPVRIERLVEQALRARSTGPPEPTVDPWAT